MSTQPVYTLQPQKSLLFKDKLGSGGEGTVYAVEGNPDICVKIYHEQKRTPELESKLNAMIDAPPKDPTLAARHYSICWPTNVVYEDEACTRFLGFIMPRIDRNIFKEYHLLCDKPGATTSTCYRLEHFGTGFTYLHMYVVALNLASCVASIHAAGHAIGDLNDKNILVSTKDSKITIVDCDSFEIHGKDEQVFPCSVYMPEYSAPEVISHKDIKNRQESDRFALSILIFKLLMLNTHPYASRGSSVEHLNTPGEKIAEGYYPYEEYAELDVNPPAYALPYDIIPPNIKALFRRCFVEGQHEPEKRPSAMEWFVAIKENYEAMTAKVKNKLVMCGNNARHFFPKHLTTCPWCAMKEEYFPVIYEMKKHKEAQFDYTKEFKYIDQLIKAYSADYQLSSDEYDLLQKRALRRQLPIELLNDRLNNFKKNNKDVIMGEYPYFDNFENKTFNFTQTCTTHASFVFHIGNEFLLEPLDIKIKSSADWIEVVPSQAIINPNSELVFTVTVLKEKIGVPLRVYKANIEVTIISNSYTDDNSITITTFSETRDDVLIEKENRFRKWPLYLSTLFIVNLLIYSDVSITYTQAIMLSLYTIVNIVTLVISDNPIANSVKNLSFIPGIMFFVAIQMISDQEVFLQFFTSLRFAFFAILTISQLAIIYVRKGAFKDHSSFIRHYLKILFIVVLGLFAYFLVKIFDL